MGIVPFTYTILEMDTIANKPTAMAVSYEAAGFTFQKMPKYDPNTIPPDHLSYVEEIKQHISNRKEEYRVILEGNTSLAIEGFSLHNASDYIYFQKGATMGSCDTMRRN